jgi:hypothetical protein
MGLTELIAEGLDVSGCCFDWDSLPVIESGHSILNSDSF